MINVNPTDPKSGYLAYRDEIDAAVKSALNSGWYILGSEVAAFEREFAAFIGVKHAIGVANGTDAITLALRGVGIGPGDGVATVGHTAIATVAAVELTGAVPVLLDVDNCHGMDPAALEAVLSPSWTGPKIKAVVPVHMYGQAAEMDALQAMADKAGIPLLEDASHAHGAEWHGKKLGSIGRAGMFSLYPTKNLPAFGDGGIITTDDDGLAEQLRRLRQYGWGDQPISQIPGCNSRLDEVQAAILRVRLNHLGEDNGYRQAIAAAYDEALAGLPAKAPIRRPGSTHVFHQYVVELAERDGLRAALAERGVKTLIHYPVPAHLQPAYRDRLPIAPGGLGNTERLAKSVLSLPLYPHLPRASQDHVIASMRAILAEKG